ncbi:MAG: Eco57I restriction-modification methylase domain-containing protein [Candidatus Heimdallarchaeota archaeon]|nr:MAG: Eco57I restriction-modification methylase domain-containing protein [Candidatus Heimdallarchaeota archaeon]
MQLNSFMNLFNTTLLDLQSYFSAEYEEKELLTHFCRNMLKRTIFMAFYIRTLNQESSSDSFKQFYTKSDILSDICELSPFNEIADIFFPLESKKIELLNKKNRDIVNDTLSNLVEAFSWEIHPKSQIENKTVTPEIFELIFLSETSNNLGIVYTPYSLVYWMVQSSFQRHFARILKITPFSLDNLEFIDYSKIEQLKKHVTQILILDISVGGGAFYLAALDYLLELNNRLFPEEENKFFYLKKILKNNLYGIDIDENVLIVCKIRLILRMLRECPSIHINDLLEILTNINLKSGNTLIGLIVDPNVNEVFYDKDFNRFLFNGMKSPSNNEALIEKLKVFNWFIEFPKVFRASETIGFDIIIGNPPYIGYRYISEEEKHILRHLYPKIYTGLNDYYYYFIWRTYQLLAPKGSSAITVARYFLEARYARKLRSQLLKSNCIDIIIDFREFKIYPKGINSVILYMTKYSQLIKTIPIYILKNFKISLRTLLGELKTSFNAFTHMKSQTLQNFSLIQAEVKDDQFILVSSTLKHLLNRIENQGVPLNQIYDIGTGYHSGKDKIFSPHIIAKQGEFFAEIKEQNSITLYPLEKEVIKKIVKTSDILPFKITWNDKYVILTKRGININDFPLTKQYLVNYKDILKKRYEVEKNLAKWYEIAQVRNPRIFNAKFKIMCPFRSRVPRFAIDKNQRYSSIDCTSLTPKESKSPNIYFVLGVLNSELIKYYLYAVAKKMDAQKIELYPKTISKIPLKLPETIDEELLYKEITTTTKSICRILDSMKLTRKNHQFLIKYGKKGLSKINKESNELLQLSKRLDMLVYQLYGIETEIGTLKSEIINP